MICVFTIIVDFKRSLDIIGSKLGDKKIFKEAINNEINL